MRTEFKETQRLHQELIAAVDSNDLPGVQGALDRGADVRAGADQALRIAAVKGRLDLVRLLVQKGADVNARPKPYMDMPLSLAASAGHLDVLQYLVDQGATLSQDVTWVLTEALEGLLNAPTLPVIQYLFEHCDIGSKGLQDSLQTAIQYGELPVVRFLVSRGADLNGPQSALSKACQHGRLDIAQYVVEQGCVLWAGDQEPIQYAAAYGFLDVVQYLVALGASVEAGLLAAQSDAVDESGVVHWLTGVQTSRAEKALLSAAVPLGPSRKATSRL